MCEISLLMDSFQLVHRVLSRVKQINKSVSFNEMMEVISNILSNCFSFPKTESLTSLLVFMLNFIQKCKIEAEIKHSITF